MNHRVSGILFLFVVTLSGGLLFSKARLERKIIQERNGLPALKPLQAAYRAESIKRYNFGFQNLISALTWVQLLQKNSTDRVSEGQVSWEYAQLNLITTLDPNFDRAYRYGSIFLSVFKRDNLGAKLLLERWIKLRPNYWRPHYLLGYHLFYEMHEHEYASREMLKAASLTDAPGWLSALGVRLLGATGAYWQAMQMCVEIYPELASEEGRSRLRLRIRDLNFALQKSEWNKALEHYRQENHGEPSSISSLKSDWGSEVRSLSSTQEVDAEIADILSERFDFLYDPRKKTVVSRLTPEELHLDKPGAHTNEVATEKNK